MTDTTVKVFQSTDSGAPSLSGTAGSLITLLDACLTNGYGSVTLDSVVVASNVATCTKSTGHGFTAIGPVGPVIRVAGATPPGLNGDWRITVVSSTVFTFATTGISDQTATGTITAKRAPAGFSKIFTGTNKAVYRADNVQSTRLYLRITDDGTGSASYARVRGYETMSDVDTGTGLIPTDAQLSDGGYVHKSSSADSTNRDWRIIADDRAFFVLVKNNGTSWYTACFFGDINTLKAADAYNFALICMNTSYGGSALYYINNNTTTSFLARTYAQTGGCVIFGRYGHQSHIYYIGYGSMEYPNPVNNAFHAVPIEVWESDVMRGLMPGFYDPVHSNSIPDFTVINSIPQLSNHALLCLFLSSNQYIGAFDITGPWR